MDINQVIKLGPLQLPVSWIILVVGLTVSTYIIEKLARKRGWEKDKWPDLVITVIFIFVMLYKFGWVIFDLKRVIKNPSSIIWTSGSTESIILGVVLALIYFVYRIYKQNYSSFDILDFSLLTLIITYFIYSLFIMDYGKVTTLFIGVSIKGGDYLYHPVNWYKGIWLGFLLLLRFKLWAKEFNNQALMKMYLFTGIGLLLASIFDVSINLLLGFTIEQWFYLLLASIGAIGVIKKG